MKAARILERLEGQRPERADPLGWRCFQFGVFVLPSSALFAGLLLLVALIQGSRRRSPGWWIVFSAICSPTSPAIPTGLNFASINSIRQTVQPAAWVC